MRESKGKYAWLRVEVPLAIAVGQGRPEQEAAFVARQVKAFAEALVMERRKAEIVDGVYFITLEVIPEEEVKLRRIPG